MNYSIFGTAENISLLALIVSAVSLLLTLIFNRREPPNIMPNGHATSPGRLSLNFLNTSNINIKNLTILINGFGTKDFGEIKALHIADKFLFTIGEKTVFNYSFILGEWAKKGFYFRARFKGEYQTKCPFLSWGFEQSIWYSFLPENVEGNKIEFQLHATYKDDLEKLESKNSDILEEYEYASDGKFF